MSKPASILKLEEPPRNVEAEQGLIGAVLMDNGVFATIGDLVTAEDFAFAEHVEIWKQIGARLESDQPANPITLKAALSFEVVGQMSTTQYLMTCSKNPANQMVCRDYARLVADLAARRKLLAELMEAVKKAQSSSPEFSTADLIDDLGGALFNIPVPREDDSDDSNEATVATLEQRIIDKREGKAPAVPMTGLSDVDRILTGLHPGRLIIGAGRPGMGKTQFGVALARRVARQGFGVLSFSAEINKDERLARLIAAEAALSHTKLTYSEIMTGDLDDSHFQSFQNYSKAAAKLPIVIDDRGGPTIGQIELIARKAQKDFERQGLTLGLIDIDYLGLLRAGNRYRGNRVMEIGEISAGAKNLAKRLKTTVLLWSQLNRAVETRDDKRPILSDLRDSGNIEQDADQVFFLYRPAYYDDKVKDGETDLEKLAEYERRANDLEVIVGKNRLGPTRKATLYCDIKYTDIAGKQDRSHG